MKNQKDEMATKSNQYRQINRRNEFSKANQSKSGSRSSKSVTMVEDDEEETETRREIQEKEHQHDHKTPEGGKKSSESERTNLDGSKSQSTDDIDNRNQSDIEGFARKN